jgi:cytochrome c-type biogenesis protein CcmH/NrfG
VIVEKQRAHSFAAARSHVDALMQFRLGELFAKQRRPANAVARYAAALQLNPDYPEALNNLAWIRATDPTLRDNAEALRLASRACDLTEYHDPQMLGTLATALVNAGRLKEGIAAARKVHELALAKGDTNLAEQSRRFIEAYESRSR